MTQSPLKKRIWRFITVGTPNGCCIWTGGLNKYGYGKVWVDETHRAVAAHRVIWEMVNGPIPAEVECDHLCRNRACVNPRHIELVTTKTNILRGASWAAVNAKKTHCIRGHPFDETNTYLRPKGGRGCRICRREQKHL